MDIARQLLISLTALVMAWNFEWVPMLVFLSGVSLGAAIVMCAVEIQDRNTKERADG